jgi:cobalt/nickel transport system ATP-binding protein
MEITDNKKVIINLKDICFKYPGTKKIVIDNLNLKIHYGDRIGIMAPNGSGKTTLFHLIMGLLIPDSGTIEIFGKPVKTEKDFEGIRSKIGLLFQDSDDQLFTPTVLEDVAFGPLNMGKSRDQAKKIAMETLDQLGLIGFENRVTYMLSGGEKRMVALATVLAMQPEMLLLDEPSTGLDEKTKDRLIEVLSELDLSYILISHEHNFLYHLSHSLYLMENGKIYKGKKKHQHLHAHPHISHEHE